jgi:hypothetical protein
MRGATVTTSRSKRTIIVTIHPSLAVQIHHLETVREGFETLQHLFEKSTATTKVLYDIRNNGTVRDTVHSPESANDHVRRCSHVTDVSRRDDEVSNRSGRRSVDVPRSEPHPEHKQKAMSQGIVERKRGPRVGEKGRESRGRDDERVAAASELGNGAMDQTTSGVGLVKPTSSQDLPEA